MYTCFVGYTDLLNLSCVTYQKFVGEGEKFILLALMNLLILALQKWKIKHNVNETDFYCFGNHRRNN
jgi:hypothetical protein